MTTTSKDSDDKPIDDNNSDDRNNNDDDDNICNQPPPAEPSPSSSSSNLWTRLASEVLSEIRPLAIATVSLIASSSCNHALFGLLRKLLEQKPSESSNNGSNSNNINNSVSAAESLMPLVVVAFVGGISSFIRTMSVSWVEDRVAARLRSRAVQSLFTERDLEWFQTEHDDGIDGNDQKRSNVTVKPQAGGTTTATAPTNSNELPNNGTGPPCGNSKEQKKKKKQEEEEELMTITRGMTPGAIGTILNVDTPQVAHAVASSVTNGIRSACSCVFGTYRMFQLNPTLLGTSICILPAMGMLAATLNKYVKQAKQEQVDANAVAAAFCEERLTHIAMVKISSREQDEVQQYNKLQDKVVQAGKHKALLDGMFMGFMFTAGSGALFGIFHLGGRSVASGKMTSGQLAMFGTNSFMLALGAAGVMRALGEISESLVCARRVYRLIDGPTQIVEPLTLDDQKHQQEGAPQQPRSVSEAVDPISIDGIQMVNVSFAYKSNPDSMVLRNVSLKLKRGKIVALVGKNGSGKTTIASLLGAMYTPRSGHILLTNSHSNTQEEIDNNSIDYNQLDRQTQKRLVQIVPQEPALFNTSILENVRYSQPTATEEEAWAALTMANCNNFIFKLEEGIHFSVGPHNGSRLSSGQRQRLGLARALLSNPPILVLDEPQSSLDAEGESAVLDAIQACRSGGGGGASQAASSDTTTVNGTAERNDTGRALLLITHNAKSLQYVDEIVVLKDGQVIETGTFAELTTQNPKSALCQLMPDLKMKQ